MYKICRHLPVFLAVFLIATGANGNTCISYKITPKITINIPEYTKTVTLSQIPMDLLHGNVVATFMTNYDITANITNVNGGYCVGLKSIDAQIGYSDFSVQIDGRHDVGSCSYNAILSHENRHIDAYLSVVDDNKKLLHDALYFAADSIMPIFVNSESEINDTVEKINSELQSHPDIVLAIQKIHADEEINNKNIDANEDNGELKKCLE